MTIKLYVSRDEDEVLNDTIAFPWDDVRIGIPNEYASAIIKSVEDTIIDLGGFPSGSLEFNLGAHGLVGSSQMIFKKVAKLLIMLLVSNVKELPNNELLKKFSQLIQKELSC